MCMVSKWQKCGICVCVCVRLCCVSVCVRGECGVSVCECGVCVSVRGVRMSSMWYLCVFMCMCVCVEGSLCDCVFVV